MSDYAPLKSSSTRTGSPTPCRELENYDGSWTEYGSLVGVPVER